MNDMEKLAEGRIVASNYDAKDISICPIGWCYSGFQASLTTSRQEAAMRHPKHQVTREEDLFVWIDLHKNINW
jgi:hypothetical protein